MTQWRPDCITVLLVILGVLFFGFSLVFLPLHGYLMALAYVATGTILILVAATQAKYPDR